MEIKVGDKLINPRYQDITYIVLDVMDNKTLLKTQSTSLRSILSIDEITKKNFTKKEQKNDKQNTTKDN